MTRLKEEDKIDGLNVLIRFLNSFALLKDIGSTIVIYFYFYFPFYIGSIIVFIFLFFFCVLFKYEGILVILH